MNQEVLTLAPGGQALAQSLGFEAATVTVDNYTNSYVTLTDVGRTIPPWLYGAVVPLPPGITRATAKLTATTPAIPGPPVPLSQAVLTWTDAVLPPDPGHLLQQVTTQQQTVIGTITAGVGATVSQDFAVPAGSLAIGFAVRSQTDPTGGSFDTPQLVEIIGDQTNQVYFDTGAATNTSVLSAPLDTSDTSVTCNVKGSGAHRSQVDFLAWPVLPVMSVRQNPGDTALNAVLLETGTSIAIDTDNPAAGQFELGVSMFHATPALWQAAAKRQRINSAAASFSVLGAPATGYKLLGALLAIRAGAAGFIELSDGTTPICDVWLPAVNNSIFVPMFGLPLATAISGSQTGGNTCDGQLYYSGS